MTRGGALCLPLQAAALAAVQLYRQFPMALAPFAGSLHALVGHYCHTVALYSDAVHHFQCAQQVNPPSGPLLTQSQKSDVSMSCLCGLPASCDGVR